MSHQTPHGARPPADGRPLGIAGSLTRAFITSPLTPLLLIAALALGLIALITLPREEEPQIAVPMVDIIVQANGLKATDAVKLVTEPLETIVKGIDGVEHVYSKTYDDQVVVTARFLVGSSTDAAILRVHDKVRANLDKIPAGIPEPLIIGRGIDDVAIVVLTLSPKPAAAARWSSDGLTSVARELRTEISKLDNVGLTYLVGDQADEIRVEPDSEALAKYGVTLQQLAAKVQGANTAFKAGLIRDKGLQIEAVAGRTLQTIPQIGDLLITTRDNRPVYLRDVAKVTIVGEPNETRVGRFVKDGHGGLQGAPAVSVAIAKRAGSNAVVIAKQIIEQLQDLKGRVVPNDINVEVSRNYGQTANEKANELLFHLGLATLSIVALVAFAIGWREGVVVAVVIPTTILLTLFAARIMGYTLNRVSLFALIFSIGILVDDAIVVIENIARHWAMRDGRSRVQAAIDGVAEVGNPTIVATLTVVAALLPMLFVSGLMGPYMSPIPANASAAMVFSFFVAVILTPWLMIKVAGKAPPAHHEASDGGKLGGLYRIFAAPVLRTRRSAKRFLIIVGVATLASLSLFYFKLVTVKLLPFDNKSEIAIIADLPHGTSVEETNRVLRAAIERLRDIPEIVSFETYAGTAAPFNFNGLVRHYYMRNQPEMGDVQINLTSKDERERTSHQIALEIRHRLAGLAMPKHGSLKVVEPPPGPPVLATLLAEIYGPDPQTRRAVAAQVRKAFESAPFIVDVDDSYGVQAPRKRIEIDQDSLEFFGVQQSDVFQTLKLLYGDTVVGYSHRGGGRQPLPIVLALAKNQIKIDESALTTPVPANSLPGNRSVVELGDVVRVSDEQSSFPLFRHNGRFAEMVTAELAGAYEAPLYGMLAVDKKLDEMKFPPGLEKPRIILHGQPLDESKPSLLWDGEWEVTWVTFRDMGAAFMAALVGIYILVVAQFKSFKLPLVILTPIPLTFIGIMFGHWLFHADFTATSMIGFIALAGIIVRNSILLVDFVRHADKSQGLRNVLIEAGAIRFKPILLTALAAMIGAAVILSDPIFQGLAISLLFGLASSTALTVLVIPAIYVVMRGGPKFDNS
ncbi:efflux RND transporter permease subunit [Rhodoblastus acidophilus]|uniref:Efflux RND transporter permease subunit n=1 Tax=Candidatus Rhodoblastus alkanivorans TaxID=2954117 RepID=A0ABS9Z8M7_9HYPH|nr:efflux RND transporter permease subunit [Candidatus Rhodoblastus alkanivorans]MCI4679330.1 efflux RND transporter permease subunit [Candidatus Rhodoblastus alkanivorans]MCI4684043.1 efflux RND transporter permease subunit [Candidatus Rhodoblastus alkanivorans]MDI4641363.1 efflux RND transporter permease subunit [Rhodoblastus acidophilus]